MWLIVLYTLLPNKLTNFLSSLPQYMVILIILILPFLIGFIMNPLGNLTTKIIRKICGEPTYAVLDKNEKTLCIKYVLYENFGKKIKEEVFGKTNTSTSPFYWAKTYIELYGSEEIKNLLDRKLSLVNLMEGVILPTVLISIILPAKYIPNHPCKCLILLLFLAVTTMLLSYRYMQLRQEWAKSVYRTFLLLRSKKILN